jgi:hypothetical protein
MYNFGNNKVFGRTSGGFDIKSDHELFLWNDFLENVSVPQYSINIPSGVYGLIIDNDFVYTSTGNSSGTLTVTDLSLSSTTAIYVDLPLSGRVMKCYLDNIYILGNNSSTIYKIHFN